MATPVMAQPVMAAPVPVQGEGSNANPAYGAKPTPVMAAPVMAQGMAQPVMAMGIAQPGVVVQQAPAQNVIYVQADGQPREDPQENCAKVMFILTCCSILFWPFIFVGL